MISKTKALRHFKVDPVVIYDASFFNSLALCDPLFWVTKASFQTRQKIPLQVKYHDDVILRGLYIPSTY